MIGEVIESEILRPDQAVLHGEQVICGDAEAFWLAVLAELDS